MKGGYSTEIERSIVEFVKAVQPEILNVFNRYRVAPIILRVEDRIHPNVWGGYLTNNLRQKALIESKYVELANAADFPIFVKNGGLEEGFKKEDISGRPVFVVDLSYSAKMYDYCKRLYDRNVLRSFYVPIDHRRVYPCEKNQEEM